MVFDLKNALTHKRISAMVVFSLLVFLALSFFLVQTSLVSAQSSDALLTGVISDRGVDTDDDGTFNYLQIGVEVNVSVAGTFQVVLNGFLDAQQSYSAVSEANSSFLEEGVQVVYLYVDDSVFYLSGFNPVSIASLAIYDENDTALHNLSGLSLSREYFSTEFDFEIKLEFNEIKRGITLSQEGSILITNTYSITNLGDNTTNVKVGLPGDAYDITFWDEMGNLETVLESGEVTVGLRDFFYTNETETLYSSYYIPWETYVTQQNGIDYTLHFTFYEQFTEPIAELSVSITLPEGADFQSSTPDAHGVLQDSITFSFSDVTPSEDLSFDVNYRYLVFWSSFYPTIWVGIVVVVASAFAFLWKVPKPTTSRMIPVPPEDIKKFVDAYEEKTRIRSELESMEKRLRKGKIPRRRFKVRKKMLDGRLSAVSRNLSSLRDKIRTAGPKYANLMRQIEVAETNLEGAERDTQRVKARYRRGEVSRGAYGKLVDEYKRRSEEAEATIDGVILRLKEEIR